MCTKDKKLTVYWLVLLLGLVGPAANAAGLAEKISQGVSSYIEQNIDQLSGSNAEKFGLDIKVQPIDHRLQLKPCADTLSYTSKAGGHLPGRALVKVSCPSQQAWSVYVPAAVSWEQDIVVTTDSLQRGQEIVPGDVTLERRRLLRPGAKYAYSLKQVVGKMAGRRLAANKAVDWRFLELADLVRKGEAVQLLAQSEAIAVKIEARALTSGGKGEQIQVRNPLSNRVVDAVVTGRGRAEVRL